MPDEPADFNKEEETLRDDDWENRILCSDDSCIGVVGPDGRCKECGKPYQGEKPPAGEKDKAPVEVPPQEEPDVEMASRFDDDWENRTLCSDESCIGVVGPDGRCKECGKPYEG
jgi:hypothetical protein